MWWFFSAAMVLGTGCSQQKEQGAARGNKTRLLCEPDEDTRSGAVVGVGNRLMCRDRAGDGGAFLLRRRQLGNRERGQGRRMEEGRKRCACRLWCFLPDNSTTRMYLFRDIPDTRLIQKRDIYAPTIVLLLC